MKTETLNKVLVPIALAMVIGYSFGYIAARRNTSTFVEVNLDKKSTNGKPAGNTKVKVR